MLVTAVFLTAVATFESVGFRLSYEALHHVAVDNGVTEGSAWMFPVLVDGGIVLGSIGVVRALAGRRSTRPYWTVTVGFTLVSWAFNVSHAPRTPGGWAVATVAPLAQMVALEMGMQELRALLLPQPADAGQHEPAPAPAPAATAPLPVLSPAAPAPAALLPAPPEPAAVPPAAVSTGQQSQQQRPQQQPQRTEQQQPQQQQQALPELQQQQEQAPPEPQQQDQKADDDGQQRQQRQRPVLQPDDSMPWAVLYEECSTEDERIALTRGALADRPKLTAPQWAVDIGKSETRGRDLLRAARKPHKELAAAG